MNIHARLTLIFTLIVASLLIAFVLSVYWLSAKYRKEEFFSRLESMAVTTARLLLEVNEVDKKLLQIIDKNSIHALYEEKVLVFDEQDSLVYSSLDDLEIQYSKDLLERIRKEKSVESSEEDNEKVGMVVSNPGRNFVIIAYAYDRFGRSKLKNLRNVLISGLMISIGVIFVSGRLFAGQALVPLARLNEEISTISAGNLDQRVDEGNQKDEIAQLAMNFNKMLERLESAFEIQKNFVSSASHELRTPLAAISSQLQVALAHGRTAEEYRAILQSILEDAQAVINLTNALLMLAQSRLERDRIGFTSTRADEIVFSAQKELSISRPEYYFQIDYTEFPNEESALLLEANEHLLRTAFINLMDNACKYSMDKTVRITISFPLNRIKICFADQGIGVLRQEAGMIFSPFFRGSNIKAQIKGYGMGLAICKRIIELHQGDIQVESAPGEGSRFVVELPSMTKI
ncbi:MAG: ATP-binding protein [Saprospiraceae bacterium]